MPVNRYIDKQKGTCPWYNKISEIKITLRRAPNLRIPHITANGTPNKELRHRKLIIGFERGRHHPKLVSDVQTLPIILLCI